MKGPRKRGRYGTLLFVLPIAVVIIALAYQLITLTYFSTGTLAIEAQSSSRYYPSLALNVSVNVGAISGTTPLTLTLVQGSYTVLFPKAQWYSAPPSQMVSVLAGRTSYAVGVYDPIVKGVSIEGNQFNATTISARHGVTPVVWINKMSAYAIVQGAPTGTIMIQPSQNYTYVFQSAGKYTLTLLGGSSSDLTVIVA